MIKIVLAFILSANLIVKAQEINIIPKPVSANLLPGEFGVSSNVTIVYENKELISSAQFLQTYLNTFYKINLKISHTSSASPMIQLSLFPAKKNIKGNQVPRYSLNIQQNSILLEGSSSEAVFNGVQTIIQLLPTKNGPIRISCIKVNDEPRFQYRGLHLDVGRHFMPVDFIKKYIDYIALHKMNYFHWHLTEDQGWRIEIKKYPGLTEIGAWRNGTIIGPYPGSGNDKTKHGGFYTQEEIKEIVKYAEDRFVTIVPEIEMPGHGSAAIAAYPELSCFPQEPTINYFPKNCEWYGDSTGKQVQQTWGVFDDVFCAGKENTFNFLENVLDEVIALFPGKYIHVGGDECPKDNWKRCPNCQKRIKDNKLKDEQELQSYFIRRIQKYLKSKDKILIGWDEILEGGLAPKAIVMSWQGEVGGITAAKAKHNVIMTPGDYCYLNNSQSENEDSIDIDGYLPLEKVYGYEPIPAALHEKQEKFILGAQGSIWTEYMKNTSIVEYMIFPRLSALSEVLWSSKEKRNWNDFEKRLQFQFKRYGLWKTNYSKAYFDLKASILPTENYNGILWKVETRQPGTQINFITHTAGNTGETKFIDGKKYVSPVLVNRNMIIAAIGLVNGKTIGNPVYQTFRFNKATGKKITLVNESSKNYPGDGAFTLVNGIQNEKGLSRSKEFLGFSGTDCIATIDLGKEDIISNVIVHCLRQTDSWIWRPLTIEVFVSANGTDFIPIGLTDDFNVKLKGLETGTMKVEFAANNVRYIKVVAKNWGEIPAGNPGAGMKAWLFVDEIEIQPPTP